MSSVQVIILYFGRLRELTGTAREQLDFDPSIVYTAQTIRDHLIEHRPIPFSAQVHSAWLSIKNIFLTPIPFGSAHRAKSLFCHHSAVVKMDYVQLQNESIKLDELYQRVVAPSCGAVASFIGITRDNFEGRRVTRLSYEAYDSMALKELHRLCDAARQQFNGVEHIAICHRLGDVPISDASVAIFVSGSHRRDVLDAVSFLIERLKASIPIWKREFYEEDANSNNNTPRDDHSNENKSTSSYCWKENT